MSIAYESAILPFPILKDFTSEQIEEMEKNES